MKKCCYLIVFFPTISFGAVCGQLAFNPITQKLDCVGTGASISSSTLPSGSTQYIQNTSTPSTPTQVFSVMQAVIASTESAATWTLRHSNPSGLFAVSSNYLWSKTSSLLGTSYIVSSTSDFQAFGGGAPNIGGDYDMLQFYDTGFNIFVVNNSGQFGFTMASDNVNVNVPFWIGTGGANDNYSLTVYGTGSGGGASSGQIAWFDAATLSPLGVLEDVGNGHTGAFFLIGDSLNAPFGEMGEFDTLDLQLQPGDARVFFMVPRIDNSGGFRCDFGIRNAGGSLVLPFGVTPTGVVIGGTVDGLEPSAFLHILASGGSAGSTPFKIDSGILVATPESGSFERNSAGLFFDNSASQRDKFAFTTSTQTWNADQSFSSLSASTITIKTGSTLNARAGGVLFDYLASTQNTSTSETDLYVSSLTTKVFFSTGCGVNGFYGGSFANVTSNKAINVYVGTTTAFASSAINFGAATTWTLDVRTIRVTPTGISFRVTMNDNNATSTVLTNTGVVGANFAQGIILRVTGTASSTGAATGDIKGTFATVDWKPPSLN